MADVAHGFGALRPLIIEPLVGDARDVDHPVVIRDPNPIEAERRLGQEQLVGSENKALMDNAAEQEFVLQRGQKIIVEEVYENEVATTPSGGYRFSRYVVARVVRE